MAPHTAFCRTELGLALLVSSALRFAPFDYGPSPVHVEPEPLADSPSGSTYARARPKKGHKHPPPVKGRYKLPYTNPFGLSECLFGWFAFGLGRKPEWPLLDFPTGLFVIAFGFQEINGTLFCLSQQTLMPRKCLFAFLPIMH